MRGEVRDKLWRQLESEILLQRHKTVVRACRRNSLLSSTEKICPKPDVPCINEAQSFGDIRTVVVKRKTGQGLGISITVSVIFLCVRFTAKIIIILQHGHHIVSQFFCAKIKKPA